MLRDVAKRFRTPGGLVHAVRGVDLTIAPGETIALLGPNGAGKSTTIDGLLGLVRPDRGSVSVRGRSPREAVDAGLVGAMLQTASGRTVLFATHYHEEADSFADRAVLMANGAVVAAAPTSEIRARVGWRTLRATLDAPDVEALAALPGVAAADLRGDVLVASCADSDATIRALLEVHPEARDIEIASTGLEDAFVELTGTEAAEPEPVGGR